MGQTGIIRGVRPVIVIQNNMGNKYSPTIGVIPITSRRFSNELPTHVNMEIEDIDSTALIDQMYLSIEISSKF